MHKISLVLTTLLMGFYSYAESKNDKACFAIEGMTCATCSLTLKAAVNKLDGIAKVEASVDEKSAQVEFDPTKTNKKAIGKKIDSVGYTSKLKQCS